MKELIQTLERKNYLKLKQLEECTENIRNAKEKKKELKEPFEKLLMESTNSQCKSILPNQLSYYLKKFDEKINMLERWTQLIYAGDNNQDPAKELNLRTVQDMKKIKSLYSVLDSL